MEEAIPLLAEAADHAALARVWGVAAQWKASWLLLNAEAIEAADRSFEQARLAGDERLQLEATGRVLGCHFWGPTPVTEALAYFAAHPELERRAPDSLMRRAALEALIGRFADARALASACFAAEEERGNHLGRAVDSGQLGVMIELLAGEPEAAIALGLEAYEELVAMDATGWASTAAVFLAQANLAAGRPDAAERWTQTCEELGDTSDRFNELVWRWTRGVAVARRGEFDEGERLARTSVEIADRSDQLVQCGDAHTGLARVLGLAGRDDEARVELEEALRLYELKGATVLVERTRTALAQTVG